MISRPRAVLGEIANERFPLCATEGARVEPLHQYASAKCIFILNTDNTTEQGSLRMCWRPAGRCG